MIIETFLELIGSRPTLESELKEKLDKGPKRLRVPTREELKFDLAKIQAEYNEIDSKYDKKYSEYNPQSKPSVDIGLMTDPLDDGIDDGQSFTTNGTIFDEENVLTKK